MFLSSSLIFKLNPYVNPPNYREMTAISSGQASYRGDEPIKNSIQNFSMIRYTAFEKGGLSSQPDDFAAGLPLSQNPFIPACTTQNFL
jgi:hypothetical protein